jgi:hypothetical protein
MSKLISYVGFSRVAGKLKFRTAGNEARVFQLEKLGDTDVTMMLLPKEMTKNEAAKFALTNFFKKVDAEVEALFVANATDENPFKVKKVVKPKTVKVTKPGLKIGSVVVRADDAPYTPKQAAKIRAEFMKKLKSAYEAN